MALRNPLIGSPGDLLRILRGYPLRWLVPLLVVPLLAAWHAVNRPDTWEASQALILRNEAAGNGEGPGKFRQPEELKAALETILEVAKSRGVLSRALAEVGPPEGCPEPAAWPAPADVTDFGAALALAPPHGAEFGTTEVFYLKIKDQSPQRAVALATSVCNQLQARFQQLRDTKAQSMIAELGKAVSLAEVDLDAATQRLTEMEHQVGSDLAELRILHESASGDSDLRKKALELDNELRQARLAERSNEDLLKLLASAKEDQGHLLATPNRLLESQPALRRLKDGLVDAQLRTAQLLGGMTEAHPQVKAARHAEQEISRHLHNELDIALRGVEVDLGLSSERVRTLEEQSAAAQLRLTRLAGLRAQYANLVADARHRTQLVEGARQKLVETRGSQAGVHTASLIAQIDAPDAGTRPVGPGRAIIVLAGLVGGVLIGAGVLFLTVELLPPVQPAEPAGTPAPLADPEPRAALEPVYVMRGGLSLTRALAGVTSGNAAHRQASPA